MKIERTLARRALPLIAITFALAGLGCSHDATRSEDANVTASAGGERAHRADHERASPAEDPDDIDENTEELTALDQGESPEDLETTRQIRSAVVGDSSLSFAARNCVIITHEGLVTLRGDVTSSESAAIERHAVRVIGAGHVQNDLRAIDRASTR